jgi:hypothetical protein
MAWQTNMTILLRDFIDDAVPPYEYDDSRLEQVLCTAAFTVLTEVDFSYSYTVDVEALTITPDPVDTTSEAAFQILVCRKAAVIILSGEFRVASNKAMSFRDGPSQMDMKGVAEAKRAMLRDAKAEYARARTTYLTGDGMHGSAIVTPMNIGIYGGLSSKTITQSMRDGYGNWN